MAKYRGQIRELLEVFEEMKKTNGAFYTDVITAIPEGYERWYDMLKKEENHEESDFSSWVLLPVHLERGYEVLFEKGVISKEELNHFRKELVNWYAQDLRQGERLDINPDIRGRDLEEIRTKARLYSKIVDFYFQGQSGSPVTGYVAEALKHIAAMAAKIELDLGGVDDHAGVLDKSVLISLVNAYACRADDYPERRVKVDTRARKALKEIEELFRDEG